MHLQHGSFLVHQRAMHDLHLVIYPYPCFFEVYGTVLTQKTFDGDDFFFPYSSRFAQPVNKVDDAIGFPHVSELGGRNVDKNIRSEQWFFHQFSTVVPLLQYFIQWAIVFDFLAG